MEKKGFTLIEVLTVIAVLGILVLLATPRMLGHTEKADTVKIQTGIKSLETVIGLNSINNSELTKEWTPIDPIDLNKINQSGMIVDRKGSVVKEVLSEGSKLIPLAKTKNFDSIRWHGGGIFILAEDNESVYYYKDRKTYSDELSIKPDGSVLLPDGNVLPVSTDDEFTFVKESDGYSVLGKGVGYYQYTGDKSTVVVPMEIQGHKMTSYYMMFYNTNVSKVVSYNPNVTNVVHMFSHSYGDSLDLKHLDTSNVTNMAGMFWKSKVISLDLSKLETSNVTNMYGMFLDSHANVLDLKNFDTSKITNMDGMFYGSHATILDLSSFNISNVTNMYSMFADTKATIGYARTEEEAVEFNSSANKPAGLTFQKK